MRYAIGIDEVGRAAPRGRASPETKFVIGLDEVGRGALAGPVVVGAVCVPKNLKLKTENLKLGKLRDSKKLSASQRERWFAYFAAHKAVRFAVARVSPRVIDEINISRAANRGAGRALRRLRARFKINLLQCRIMLDGGLYVGERIRNRNHPHAKTIIRGDEKIIAVKIASIIAKVTRDRGMKRMSKKLPGYGFEFHKGYGTKRHVAAIKEIGLSPVHRLTFLKKIKNKISNIKNGRI